MHINASKRPAEAPVHTMATPPPPPQVAVILLGFAEDEDEESQGRGGRAPSAHWPVAGVPALERSLLWLTVSGVREVVVLCGAASTASAAEAVVGGVEWAARADLAVEVHHAAGCRSEGDALRALDQRDVIKSDFVLLVGAGACAAPLAPALAAHHHRAQQDRSSVLTVLVQGGFRCGGARGAGNGRRGARAREFGHAVRVRAFAPTPTPPPAVAPPYNPAAPST